MFGKAFGFMIKASRGGMTPGGGSWNGFFGLYGLDDDDDDDVAADDAVFCFGRC